MPTYEYKCDACNYAFERFQSIKADPVRKCPECGKNKVKRLLSMGGGLIFKGSGFYITDYRDNAYQEKAKADTAGGGSDSGGSADSKDAKDAKPETKAEVKSESKTDSKSAGSESASSGSEAKPAPKSETKTASKSAAKSAPRSSAKKK